jgi:hypothetical protein
VRKPTEQERREYAWKLVELPVLQGCCTMPCRKRPGGERSGRVGESLSPRHPDRRAGRISGLAERSGRGPMEKRSPSLTTPGRGYHRSTRHAGGGEWAGPIEPESASVGGSTLWFRLVARKHRTACTEVTKSSGDFRITKKSLGQITTTD